MTMVDCRVGVISEPQVFTSALTTKDAFIILASDGVWEFIDSQGAVDIVGNASSAEEGCRQASLFLLSFPHLASGRLAILGMARNLVCFFSRLASI